MKQNKTPFSRGKANIYKLTKEVKCIGKVKNNCANHSPRRFGYARRYS